MPAFYEKVIRPLLFTQDAEKVHEQVIASLKLAGALPPLCFALRQLTGVKADPIELFGLSFPNRVGLAAGFDKNAECVKALSSLGFGHVEIGTVTHEKQPGNPRPRLFRYPKQRALINSLGFNNEGAQGVAARLSKLPKPSRRRVPVGINIGKSRAVSIENAVEDYLSSFNTLADYADYITINVSSPNTPDLRKLQSKDQLEALLNALSDTNRQRAKKLGGNPIPILLKIAPDLTYAAIDDILSVIESHGISGIVATNTTIGRPGMQNQKTETGGLSGAPLHPFSLDVVRYIHLATSGKLPIIGVGGISSSRDAGRMMDAGASLVQLYSGMIYKGPSIASHVARGLAWTHREWV